MAHLQRVRYANRGRLFQPCPVDDVISISSTSRCERCIHDIVSHRLHRCTILFTSRCRRYRKNIVNWTYLPFRTCMCSSVETGLYWTCYVSGLCISNLPRYFYIHVFCFHIHSTRKSGNMYILHGSDLNPESNQTQHCIGSRIWFHTCTKPCNWQQFGTMYQTKRTMVYHKIFRRMTGKARSSSHIPDVHKWSNRWISTEKWTICKYGKILLWFYYKHETKGKLSDSAL